MVDGVMRLASRIHSCGRMGLSFQYHSGLLLLYSLLLERRWRTGWLAERGGKRSCGPTMISLCRGVVFASKVFTASQMMVITSSKICCIETKQRRNF
jgi:hypothetical protein